MTLTLLKNNSEHNALTKSTDILNSFTGTLKNSTSIIDPVIIVEDLSDADIANCNYAHIPEFNRYYFIKDIVSVKKNLWELTCHVDVLSTYSASILNQTAVIKRQEKTWNLYLDDGIFKTYQTPYIITKAFPNGFTSQKFVLSVAGG